MLWPRCDQPIFLWSGATGRQPIFGTYHLRSVCTTTPRAPGKPGDVRGAVAKIRRGGGHQVNGGHPPGPVSEVIPRPLQVVREAHAPQAGGDGAPVPCNRHHDTERLLQSFCFAVDKPVLPRSTQRLLGVQWPRLGGGGCNTEPQKKMRHKKTLKKPQINTNLKIEKSENCGGKQKKPQNMPKFFQN